MVRWDDATHEIRAYDDDTGHGLTRCERPIGPWDVWLEGVVTCPECMKKRVRWENKRFHRVIHKTPKDWFPKDPPLETSPPAAAPDALSSYGDSGASRLYLSCG